MRLLLSTLSILLLPVLNDASPTATITLSTVLSATTSARFTTTTATLLGRDDPNTPFLLSLDLPSISIPSISIPTPTVDIPSLTLNLPAETCTPGFPAYATPGLNGYVPPEACNALWLYSPNFAAAVVFTILFGCLLVAHLAQAILYRNGFCWVIIMAAAWETGAYAFRALGSRDQQSAGLAIVAQILVLVAPIWVNAFAYMVFARIVHFYSPARNVWLFSPSVLTLIFVTLDIVSFVVQLIGGGMAGPGASAAAQRRGLDIYMGGIGMQEGFISIFLILVVKFHRDQLQAERLGRLAPDKMSGWRQLIYALYACLAAITIRIVYRLVEFSAGLGTSNPLPKNAALLYVLESTPMWVAILVWCVIHPGRYIKGPGAKMPASWLSRHLWRCCRKRRAAQGSGVDDHVGTHRRHRLSDVSRMDHALELYTVSRDDRDRHTDGVPLNPFLDASLSREPSSELDAREQLRLRPPPADGAHREISPELPAYYNRSPRE